MLCYPTCFCICILEDRKNWGGISKISCPMNLKPLPENNRFLFGDRESEGKRVRKFVSKNKKSQSERERERDLEVEVEVEVLGEGGGGGGGFIDRLMRESKRNGGVGLAKLLFDFTVPPRWMCFFTLSTFEGLSTVFCKQCLGYR